MNFKKVLLLFAFYNLIIFSSDGQSFEDLQHGFDQFFNNYFLINPANNDTSSNVRLKLGSRRLTGLFEGVSRYYSGLNLVLPSAERLKFHEAGIFAITGKDGEYFQRSRVYGNYSYRNTFSKKVSVSLGVAVGVVNYTFKASAATAGASETVGDALVGFWLMVHRLQFGVAYGHLLERKLQPLEEIIKLNNYFNYTVNYSLPLSPIVELNGHLFIKQERNANLKIQLAPLLRWNELLEAGFCYKYERGIILVAGIRSLKVGKGKFNLMGSYLISTRNLSNLQDNVIELSGGYQFSFTTGKQ